MRMNARPLFTPFLIGALALLGATACGGERSFDANEFIEAANQEGAGLTLGEPLEDDQEDIEATFALEFETGAAHEGATEGDGYEAGRDHEHGDATLIIGADEAAAIAAYENCEGSVTLVCFRAANVAIVFSGDESGEEAQRLQAALVALSE